MRILYVGEWEAPDHAGNGTEAAGCSALSFRDAAGRELPVAEGFSRWCDLCDGGARAPQVCYFVGNGASASLASHFAADLAKNAACTRRSSPIRR